MPRPSCHRVQSRRPDGKRHRPYRYSAETAAIRFGELRSLLDERDARHFRELAAATQRIADEDVLRNFLDQETVLEPVEYIRFAVAGSDRAWPPIFYFAVQAGLAPAELAGLIEGVDTTKERRRKEAGLRVKGARSALERYRGSPARRLATLLDGDLPEPIDHKAAEHLAMAIQGLPNAEAVPLAELLALLKQCWSLVLAAQRPSALSHIFRAAARLDEVFFRRP